MNLANRLVDKLVIWQIISNEDKELYFYGFWQGAVLLYNFITVIVIGLFFGMLRESMIFMIIYGMIRPYAGGYHARTQLRCYIISVGMIIAALWLIKYIFWNGFICFVIITVSSIIILVLAPVEDANKPLDRIEQVVFKKRTNMVLGILIVLAALSWFVGLELITISISVALGMLSIMLAFGKLKWKFSVNN